MKDKINDDNGRPPNQPEPADELCDDPQSKPSGKKVIVYKGPCCDTFDATD